MNYACHGVFQVHVSGPGPFFLIFLTSALWKNFIGESLIYVGAWAGLGRQIFQNCFGPDLAETNATSVMYKI